MKKLILLLISSAVFSSSYANIPYCPGTNVNDSKHKALQYVITTFANENGCKIGNNCISNFDKVKYSIAWSQDCTDSAKRGNDPKGSTFICENHVCTPLGFFDPHASY